MQKFLSIELAASFWSLGFLGPKCVQLAQKNSVAQQKLCNKCDQINIISKKIRCFLQAATHFHMLV